MKKIAVVTLAFALLMMLAGLTAAFAKDMNYPTGVERIDYVNAGGETEIALPPLPSTDPNLKNYPNTATAMRFSFYHVEIPNAGKSFDALLVWLYLIPTGSPTIDWEPFAYITTNTEDLAFQRAFWRGSFVNFDATLYFMNPPTNTVRFPASWSTDNVIGVSSDVLKVARHGNSVTVTLNAPQQIKRPLRPPPGMSFTLPAFSLEVNGYDGSVHNTATKVLTGYPGASGYKYVIDGMGFMANGAVTSQTTWLNGAQAENATVSMHATHTYYSPTP